MENQDLEIIIEKARIVREKFVAKTIEDNAQNGVETDEAQLREQITITILGEMNVEVDGKIVKKAIFAINLDGQSLAKVYDEDFKLLGVRLESNQDIILSDTLSLEPEEEQKRIKEDINSMKGEKTIEQLEAENAQKQTDKEDKVAQDLAQNMGDSGLKIKSYRRIIDKVFPREFPEMCLGAKEIGMAELEDGTFVLAADYGNGFEMARGTEPARPTIEQVYDIDRTNQNVEQNSPHALMKVTGNGNESNTKEIAVTIGAYGYIETKVVDRAPDNTRIARDVAEQGEIRENEEKPLDEQLQEYGDGVDASRNIGDLVSGQENEHNDRMKQQIVDSVLQSHEEELESLYGASEEQEGAIRRYIEEAITRRGIIVPEDIQRFVEGSIEADYGQFFRDPTQH